MSDQSPNLDTLFLAALEIASPEERAAFLGKSCGEDRELRSQVERLLKSHEQVGSFLDHPAPELQATMVHDEEFSSRDLSLQAGLVVEFYEEQAIVLGERNNDLLRMLGDTMNAVPRVTLLESNADGEDSIIQSQSQEMPELGLVRRYQLQGEIGRGGTGAIIKGRDTDLGRDLAIKVLLDVHKDNPEVFQRFIEEAQIGGQLQHPGIAPIYELGQFADNRPFFTMKLVRGKTLSKLMAGRAEVADDRGKLLGIFEQICQTMAYAHSRGVIHRDLKPANIMVGAFGEVQVMDWGLAKVLLAGDAVNKKKGRDIQPDTNMIQTQRSTGSDTPGTFGAVRSDTRMGSVMGTPAYMPPEQAHGKIDSMDERADVFGLGAILCEVLTGQPPYVSDNESQVYLLASQGKLDSCLMELKACGADADLVALTEHCLKLEPADRPRDASVVAERITAYLESVETKLRETELAKVDAQVRAEELHSRNKLAFTAGAAIVVLLVIGVTASVWLAGQARSAEQRAVAAFNELRATAPAFAEQARSLAAMGRFEEAIEKLDYAVKLRPDRAEYLVAKADLIQCQLKLADAAAIYREALRVQPGHSHAVASVKLCDELLAAKPTEQGKLTRDSLAILHLAMQRQQRPAAELMPVASLIGEEKKHLMEYWITRLADLPVSTERPLKERLTIREDGRLALDLSDTKVLDLSPLAGAPLAVLNASGINNRSELTDLSPLRGLPLIELNVSNTEVENLTPLREIHTLEKLNLSNTKVTNLNLLSELQLKSLTFSDCAVSDLTPIRKMPLEEMNLRGTRVVNISPLIGMPIKSLELSMTPVLDFSPLAQLPLEKCYLQRNRIKDLSVLAGKPLKELVLWASVDARNYAVLAEIKTLELLLLPSEYRNLPAEDYHAIGKLRGHPNLRQLASDMMSHSSYSDTGSKEIFWQDWDREQTFLPALRKTGFTFSLYKLTSGDYKIDIRNQPVRDISFLKGAPIGELVAMNCGIADLSPLEGMPLKLLNVFGNPISDLGPLRGMPLERAFFTASNVSDLSPLTGLPLRDLYLNNCRNLTDVSPLAEVLALENLVFPPQVTNIETLRKLPKLRRLGLKASGDAPIQADTTAEEFWKKYETTKQLLEPGTVAIWNFDSETDGWQSIAYCEFSRVDGTLQTTLTDRGARLEVRIPPTTAEWNVFSFRARSNQQLPLKLYWSTTVHGESEMHSGLFALGEAGKNWQDYYFCFRADGDLTKLRLDPHGLAGQQVEFDWIRLERSNEELLRALAGELVQRVKQGDSTTSELNQLAQLLEALDGVSGRKHFQEILTGLGGSKLKLDR